MPRLSVCPLDAREFRTQSVLRIIKYVLSLTAHIPPEENVVILVDYSFLDPELQQYGVRSSFAVLKVSRSQHVLMKMVLHWQLTVQFSIRVVVLLAEASRFIQWFQSGFQPSLILQFQHLT